MGHWLNVCLKTKKVPAGHNIPNGLSKNPALLIKQSPGLQTTGTCDGELGSKGKDPLAECKADPMSREINRVRTFKRHWAAGIGFIAFFVPDSGFDSTEKETLNDPLQPNAQFLHLILTTDSCQTKKRGGRGGNGVMEGQERAIENECGVWREWMWNVGKNRRNGRFLTTVWWCRTSWSRRYSSYTHPGTLRREPSRFLTAQRTKHLQDYNSVSSWMNIKIILHIVYRLHQILEDVEWLINKWNVLHNIFFNSVKTKLWLITQ